MRAKPAGLAKAAEMGFGSAQTHPPNAKDRLFPGSTSKAAFADGPYRLTIISKNHVFRLTTLQKLPNLLPEFPLQILMIDPY